MAPLHPLEMTRFHSMFVREAAVRLSSVSRPRPRPVTYGLVRNSGGSTERDSHDRQRVPRTLTPRELVLVLIAVGTAVRLVLAHTIGLGIDESYQVAISRPLSLSYFDHAPLSFWIPGAIAAITGSTDALLLRLPFILLFAGTTWMMYRLGARLFGERAGAIAGLLLNITPLFSLSTGGWVLPDGPLIFWMVATALSLERVLLPPQMSETDARAWRGWLAAGTCAGLALLSKYHGIFLLGGVGLFLLTHRGARRWLRHPAPYAAAALAALIFAPVLVWNVEHDWISFRFQGARGAPGHGLDVGSLLQTIGGQLGYLLPWIALPLAWVLASTIADEVRSPVSSDPASAEMRRRSSRWLLACLAIGPIAAFTLISLNGHRGLPHWQAPGWFFAIPLLAERIDARLEQSEVMARRIRRWLAWSTGAFVFLVAIVATQTKSGWVERTAAAFRVRFDSRDDPTVQLLDWKGLSPLIATQLRAVATSQDASPSGRPFVAVMNWMDASKVAYALGPDVDVACICAEPHHFAFARDTRSYLGRDAVIVIRVRDKPLVDPPLARSFGAVEHAGSASLVRGGQPALSFQLFRARNLLSVVPQRSP